MNLTSSALPKGISIDSGRDSVKDNPETLRSTLQNLANQISSVAEKMPCQRAGFEVIDQFLIIHWIQSVLKIRQMRKNIISDEIFADPAWDILLDLTLAKLEDRTTSISSLCVAACVPNTTALRWINNLLDVGILVKYPDVIDRRRHYITISDEIYFKMKSFICDAIYRYKIDDDYF